jgi:hypothetical protein
MRTVAYRGHTVSLRPSYQRPRLEAQGAEEQEVAPERRRRVHPRLPLLPLSLKIAKHQDICPVPHPLSR